MIVAFTLWLLATGLGANDSPTFAAFLFSDTTCALVPAAFCRWTTSAPSPPSAAYAVTSRRIESTEPAASR